MRDILAIAFAVVLIAAVLATGYVMEERHYTARDMTDFSAHRRSN